MEKERKDVFYSVAQGDNWSWGTILLFMSHDVYNWQYNRNKMHTIIFSGF